MFVRIIAPKRRKPQSGGLRVTRRGRRKYAVLPVRDITFFKAAPFGSRTAPTDGADGKGGWK